MTLSDLEPSERAMFKRGEKKIKTSRNIFGDKDVLFYLKMKDLIDADIWYFITIYECPICLGDKKTRERRLSKKPTEYWERHQLIQAYDYCDTGI